MIMKKKFVFLFLTLLCLLAAVRMQSGSDSLSVNFRTVPDEQRMAVYWYWISDNISAEGVKKDLEAMKEAGITKAFIGNIWEDNVKPGNVKVFTEEWWNILHVALKHATELDMEIGIFNSPGWSQSGGPWVKPQEAMRYLEAQRLYVRGNGQEQELKLPFLPPTAQTVKLLAMPSKPFVSDTFRVTKEAGIRQVNDLSLGAPITLRSAVFHSEAYLLVDVEIQAKVDGEYKTLKSVHLDRTNHQLNVGFRPHAPIAVSLSDVEAQEVRLVLNGGPRATDLTVVLSDRPCVERYEEKTLAKMFQTPLPMWGEYMWEAQPEPADSALAIQPSEVLDLTPLLQNDSMLVWNVPEGDWCLLHTAMLPTGVTNGPASPEATGLEIDKMSRKHAETHFDAFVGEILRRIPAKDRKCFKVVVQDSYETGGQNWTDDMAEAFEQRYGYSPVPYIPVMYGEVIGSQDQSERFLWDMRRLIADRVAYDYVGGLREVCHKHGLTTWLECYGHWGFPSEFLMYGGQSDEVSGEFWSEGTLGDIENRAASSCAHIYGKQKVWAESCTSGGPVFSRYPYVMKQRTDRFFCEGINATLLHLYILQPDDEHWPGVSAWFGNEFNRKNTWFSQMDLFTDYLRRCNLMLQQGRYVADVAYYIGEDAPKMTGECNPKLPKGYSFDYLNAEVLKKAKVKHGCLTLESGMQYKLLVLPQQKTMRPEVLSCIAKLVEDGLHVVGPKPTSSPSLQHYPQADEQVREMAEEMWSADGYGKGRVYADGTDLQTILQQMQVAPDCQVPADKPVAFIHRRLKDREVYFLSNQSQDRQRFEAVFRVKGMHPEVWNPVTGEQRPLPEFSDVDGRISLPMQLEANESLFIVFRKERKEAVNEGASNFQEGELMAELNGGWSVQFQAEQRGPQEAQHFDALTDWSRNEDPAIRYYSGMASYSNTFFIEKRPEGEVYIDLGRVMVMARVYVNGVYAGGAWTYPYRVNVTDCLKLGVNELRVEVVNNWQNRLVGDARLPQSERKTYATVNPWNANSPLQESGLLGPVKVLEY